MVESRCDSCGYTFHDAEDCVGHSCGRCEEGTIWIADDDPDGDNYRLYCELHPQEDPEWPRRWATRTATSRP